MNRSDARIGMYIASPFDNKYKILEIIGRKIKCEVIEVKNSLSMTHPVGHITNDIAITMMQPYTVNLHIPKSILSI